ncbi:MAG: right-handed parallel beta-helix repeat-containing protein [Gemmatimonadales bacterium]
MPASIDRTGTQDVSAPLQAWLDSLPDSARILGPAGARYRVEFGLTVENRRAIEFDAADPANPPTLLQMLLEPYGPGDSENRNREVLSFRRGGGHTLRHWRLHGAQPNSGATGDFNPDYEAQHGLVIAGVDRMLVEDVFVTEVAGDLIYLNNPGIDGVRYFNRDITIRRVTGRKSSRQGIGVAGGINVLIEDGDFQDIKRSAFDIEPNSEHGTIQNLVVRNNIFGYFDNHWVAGHGASEATVDNLTFENNEVIGRVLKFQIIGWRTTSPLPVRNRRSNVRVINNRAHSIPPLAATSSVLMSFHAIDGVEIAGNVVDFIAADGEKRILAGAWFNESCGITYSGNTWGNAQYDHEVTVGYDPPEGGEGSTPVTEFDGANLEWFQCAELVRKSR